MPIAITHDFTSGVADGVDPTQIQPSHWNQPHTLVGDDPNDVVVEALNNPGVTVGIGAATDLAMALQLASSMTSLCLSGQSTGYLPQVYLEAGTDHTIQSMVLTKDLSIVGEAHIAYMNTTAVAATVGARNGTTGQYQITIPVSSHTIPDTDVGRYVLVGFSNDPFFGTYKVISTPAAGGAGNVVLSVYGAADEAPVVPDLSKQYELRCRIPTITLADISLRYCTFSTENVLYLPTTPGDTVTVYCEFCNLMGTLLSIDTHLVKLQAYLSYVSIDLTGTFKFDTANPSPIASIEYSTASMAINGKLIHVPSDTYICSLTKANVGLFVYATVSKDTAETANPAIYSVDQTQLTLGHYMHAGVISVESPGGLVAVGPFHSDDVAVQQGGMDAATGSVYMWNMI